MQFIVSVEMVGKDFGMEAIVVIDPDSKLLGSGNDWSVFLLLDGQDDGTIMSLGGLLCRSTGHDSPHSPLCFAKNRVIMGQVSPPGGTVKSDFFDICSCCVIVFCFLTH